MLRPWALAWGHGKGHPKFEAFDMSLPCVCVLYGLVKFVGEYYV
jgi:hypothetical protein